MIKHVIDTLPNLLPYKIISIDTETYCPAIKQHGHSFNRGGYICGISIACENASWYYDIRKNDNVIPWLKNLSENFTGLLIGTNLQYDLLYFKIYGIEFGKCSFWDISLIECLIDENQNSYSLDYISRKYINVGKNDEELYSWLSNRYGGDATRKQQACRIHLAPEDVVRPYAISDVELPLKIYNKQFEIVSKEKLQNVVELEMSLLPILVEMRYKGIKINLEETINLYNELQIRSFELDKELKEYGIRIDDIYGASAVSKAFDRILLEYPLTQTGKPSFTRGWTDKHCHPLPKLISESRKILHFKNTFVDNYLLKSHINGRIHCQYNQLRSDNFGTITGRLSASYPNLQNIPARDEVWGNKIRNLFLPENEEKYLKLDYSQIEFRLFAHYSKSHRLIKSYNDNIDIDYHDEVAKYLHNVIRRKIMKNFNFMKLYGGGKKRTIDMLKGELDKDDIIELLNKMGVSEFKHDEMYELAALVFINKYDNNFPEAKYLMKKVADVIKQRGYIKTISGRRKRYFLWKPSSFGDMSVGLPYDQAKNKYGHNLERAYTYKGLNHLCQGSAADIIKGAIVKIYKELKIVPLITVHDELGFSIPCDSSEQLKSKIAEIMQSTVSLKVPLKVQAEINDTWN